MPDKRTHSLSVGRPVVHFFRALALGGLLVAAALRSVACIDNSGNGNFVPPVVTGSGGADSGSGGSGGGTGGDNTGGSGGGTGGDNTGGSGGAAGGTGGRRRRRRRNGWRGRRGHRKRRRGRRNRWWLGWPWRHDRNGRRERRHRNRRARPGTGGAGLARSSAAPRSTTRDRCALLHDSRPGCVFLYGASTRSRKLPPVVPLSSVTAVPAPNAAPAPKLAGPWNVPTAQVVPSRVPVTSTPCSSPGPPPAVAQRSAPSAPSRANNASVLPLAKMVRGAAPSESRTTPPPNEPATSSSPPGAARRRHGWTPMPTNRRAHIVAPPA